MDTVHLMSISSVVEQGMFAIANEIFPYLNRLLSNSKINYKENAFLLVLYVPFLNRILPHSIIGHIPASNYIYT